MKGHDSLAKRFYRPNEIAEMLGVPTSTLRYWESEFPSLSPTRSRGGVRLYTAKDLTQLQQINYLVHIKGLKIEAAKKALNTNPDEVERKAEIVSRMQNVRAQLVQLLESI